jgi:hypothetical protein
LDYIGLDAYYPLSNRNNATVAELEKGWQPWLADLERLSNEWHKKIIFTEIGYQNRIDTAVHPWESNGALDMAVRFSVFACRSRQRYRYCTPVLSD